MLYINNKQMALRTIRERIKNGCTTEYFADFFGVDAKTFLNALEKRTGTKFKEYARCFCNEKRAKTSVTDLPDVAQTSNITNVASKTNNYSYEKESEKKSMSIIENGYNREEELTAIIKNLMAECEELSQKCEENDKSITQKQEEKKLIQEKLKKCLEEVQSLHEKYSVAEAEISKLEENGDALWERYSQKDAELTSAQEELESYKSVEVYFDENGLHVSNEDFIPSKESVSANFLLLSEDENYASYEVKELRALAAIRTAIEGLESVDAKFVLEKEKCTDFVQVLIEKDLVLIKKSA